jgi:hypothetical protein
VTLLREALRRRYVAPITIGVSAAVLINAWLGNISSPFANVVIRLINRFGTRASYSFIPLNTPLLLGWKYYVLITCAAVAVLFVIWLISIWFYPESLRDEPSLPK